MMLELMTGEMAQQLEKLTVLVQDLCSLLSTQSKWFPIIYNSNPRVSVGPVIQSCDYTHTHIHN